MSAEAMFEASHMLVTGSVYREEGRAPRRIPAWRSRCWRGACTFISPRLPSQRIAEQALTEHEVATHPGEVLATFIEARLVD